MDFESQISFLYYKNLEQAVEFYERIFNFPKTIDQGWAKIYKVSEGSFLGLVDERKGYFDWQPKKTVMITLVTKQEEEVDLWYEKLLQMNVKIISKPKNIEELKIRCFLFEDPEGYVIEIQYFYEK